HHVVLRAPIVSGFSFRRTCRRFPARTTNYELRTAIALRTATRARCGSLPARLADAWDLSLQRHLPKADPAHAELPEVGAAAAAAAAAVHLANAEAELARVLL